VPQKVCEDFYAMSLLNLDLELTEDNPASVCCANSFPQQEAKRMPALLFGNWRFFAASRPKVLSLAGEVFSEPSYQWTAPSP
jgi:hypothetical protein